MQCAKCGAALHQAHTCGPALDLPTGWIVASTFLIGLATLFAVASVVYAVLRVESLGSGLDQLGALAFLAALLGLLAVSVLWQQSTRRLADSYGGDGRQYARHWGRRQPSLSRTAQPS